MLMRNERFPVPPSRHIRKRSIVLLLVPNFTIIAFAGVVETLRLANRIVGYEAYHWRYASLDGGRVVSSSGIDVEARASVASERGKLAGESRPDLIVVCSGLYVEQHRHRSISAYLVEAHRQGIAMAGVCTGAYVLAQAGLLDDRRCAIHWESIPGFAEDFPYVRVQSNVLEVDDNIHTCAGGTASLDLALHWLREDFGEKLVSLVSEQHLTDRVRTVGDRQRLPLNARLGIGDSKILSIIEVMEQHLTSPVTLSRIAELTRISRRQIERLFSRKLDKSPARYYLEIRLERSRYLLIQSSMPVVEVAVACGFVSASHFAKCYRELYGSSPQETRNFQRRAAMLKSVNGVVM